MAEETPNIPPIGSGTWQGIVAESSAQLADQAITGNAAVWDGAIGGNRAQAANRQGSEAATAIRARFYQQEWDQVRKTRVSPVMERMTADEKQYKDQMLVAPRRVESFVDPVQAGERTEQLRSTDVIPGKPTPEGTPNQPEAMIPSQAAPNPAINPGSLGAVETRMLPSIMDPSTGDPVSVMKGDAVNPRAYAIMQELTNSYWKKNEDSTLELMDIYGEYQSNPYISSAAKNLMQNVTDQAGQAVTGKSDPQAQMEWWEGRQEFQGKMEAQDVETKQKVFDYESGEAGVDATTPFVKERAEEGSLPLDKDISRKLLSDKKLTPYERKVAAHALVRQERLEKEGLDQRKDAGLQVIPNAVIPYTRDWHGRLANNDRGYQNYYAEEMAVTQNDIQSEFVKVAGAVDENGVRNPEPLNEFLDMHKASANVRAAALASDWEDESLLKWLELMSNTSVFVERAQDKAFIKRIEEVAHGQPQVEKAIDDELNSLIARWKENPPIDKKTQRRIIMTPEREEELWANKYAEFFTSIHERKPPADYELPPRRARRIKAIRRKADVKAARREATLIAEREASGAGGPGHLESLLPPEERPTARAPAATAPSRRPLDLEPIPEAAGSELYQPGSIRDIEVTEETFNKPLAQSIAEFFSGRDLGQYFETNQMKKERLDKARIEAGK